MGVIFLGGFMSNMQGSKAQFLHDVCEKQNIPFTRFDYFGHGSAYGEFSDYVMGDWIQNSLDVLEHVTPPIPHILIGSSMGGWIAMKLAMLKKERIKALIGIAPAPDFTDKMAEKMLTQEQRNTIEREGHIIVPSDYDEPYIITKKLLDDGRTHFIMDNQPSIPIHCPVRILQGMCDASVPYMRALEIAQKLESDDVELFLQKNGDHSLSNDAGLKLLEQTLLSLL